jgi:hypothetical protein
MNRAVVASIASALINLIIYRNVQKTGSFRLLIATSATSTVTGLALFVFLNG